MKCTLCWRLGLPSWRAPLLGCHCADAGANYPETPHDGDFDPQIKSMLLMCPRAVSSHFEFSGMEAGHEQ